MDYNNGNGYEPNPEQAPEETLGYTPQEEVQPEPEETKEQAQASEQYDTYTFSQPVYSPLNEAQAQEPHQHQYHNQGQQYYGYTSNTQQYGQQPYQPPQPPHQQTYHGQPRPQQQPQVYNTYNTTPYVGQPMQPAMKQKKGMGIAGMVLGICSVVLFWIPFVAFIAAIVGLILSIIARNKNKNDNFALTGIILSSVGIVGGLIYNIIIIIEAVSWGSYYWYWYF